MTIASKPGGQQYAAGITLVELMVVVAILGILVALTFPIFTSQSNRTHRADATVVLTNAAALMESYAIANGNSFLGASSGTTIPAKSPLEGDVEHYSISIENLSSTTFRLLATPRNNQANDNCGVLWVDQTGRRGAEEPVEDCWR